MTALRAVLRSAAAEARANKGAFWTQVAAMALNDVVWVLFWILFFGRVGVVRGWDRGRVLQLFAVLTTGGGIVLGLTSNARRLGQLIIDGSIDAALALPVAPLPYVLVRRVDPVNLGDFVFGVVLFLASGVPTPTRILVYLAGTLTAAVILGSFLIIAGSLTFFAGRSETGELGFHAIILLSSYPVDIFGGPTKLLLYTVVPAAFVAAVPARLLHHLDAGLALGLVTAATLFAVAAWATFTLGLRRYTSSALWTRA